MFRFAQSQVDFMCYDKICMEHNSTGTSRCEVANEKNNLRRNTGTWYSHNS